LLIKTVAVSPSPYEVSKERGKNKKEGLAPSLVDEHNTTIPFSFKIASGIIQ